MAANRETWAFELQRASVAVTVVDTWVTDLRLAGPDVNVSLVRIELLGLNGIPDRGTSTRIQEYFQGCW